MKANISLIQIFTIYTSPIYPFPKSDDQGEHTSQLGTKRPNNTDISEKYQK